MQRGCGRDHQGSEHEKRTDTALSHQAQSRAPSPLKMQHVVLILKCLRSANSFPISGMASGHWQATTPKDNRGEQGGGQNPAFPAALRAARPRGAHTARWLEVATGSHSHLRRKCRQRLWGGSGYPRRGFLGTLFTGGTPDSTGNGKIPVSLGFANAEGLSAGSHLVLRWVGLLLGEPLREDSFTVPAVWKQPESSMGKGTE